MGKQRKKKKKTRRDLAETPRSVVEQTIGEPLTPREEETPDEEPAAEEDTRNPAPVALSKIGASKGGKARAEKLSKKTRREIARKGAAARWKKYPRRPRLHH